MALDKAEWRRRVAAACELHGIDLKDVELEGLPKGAARAAGHESNHTVFPNHTLALALAERFDLPVAWFEEEDWRPLVGEEQPMPPAAELGLKRQQQGLDMMREGLMRIGKMEETLTALERIESRLDRLEAQPEVEAEQPASKADLRSAVVGLSEVLNAVHRELQDVRRNQGRGEGGRASGRR